MINFARNLLRPHGARSHVRSQPMSEPGKRKDI